MISGLWSHLGSRGLEHGGLGGDLVVMEWTASIVGDLVGFFEVRFWVGLSVKEVGQVAHPIASKVPGFWGP